MALHATWRKFFCEENQFNDFRMWFVVMMMINYIIYVLIYLQCDKVKEKVAI